MKKLCFLFILAILSVGTLSAQKIQVGADHTEIYLPLLQGKRVALVVNPTSLIDNRTHLVDSLLSLGVQIQAIMAPEHGFRGKADAGETISNGRDNRTGLPIVSLYGKNKKPTTEQMSNIDLVIFDIQDVGARFYTYISTMHYVMEACAENNKPLIVLDRPNPCDFVDGPVLQPAYRSFVGMHPIPLLHGCTIGELALMINGEGWLQNQEKCQLTIIRTTGWKHGQSYSLPVKPSPNLPNDQAIALYASLCPFEATAVSVGRGTYFPFQVLGAPSKRYGSFTFTPISLPGFDKNPLHKNQLCYGMDLREAAAPKGFSLQYVIRFYHKSGLSSKFFNRPEWMDKLMGTRKVREQIVKGWSEAKIKAGWASDLEHYKAIRNKYLLYP